MQEGRWTTITPSQFDHERAALDHVRRHLPDAEPYRAWSNFTFTADTGHVYEVDLLVVTRSGLYLIEIKSLNGRLANSGSNWIADNQGKVRTFDNPLHLADLKAKRLRSLLDRQARKQAAQGQGPLHPGRGVPLGAEPAGPARRAPTALGVRSRTSAGASAGRLPGIWSGLLSRLPQDERHLHAQDLSKALPELLEGVGIARSRRYYQVGSWQLEAKPVRRRPDLAGPPRRSTPSSSTSSRRIRIYLVERNSAKAERASIERAARREMLALHGISHPGIVQVDTMEPHDGGPALIFRHDPRADPARPLHGPVRRADRRRHPDRDDPATGRGDRVRARPTALSPEPLRTRRAGHTGSAAPGRAGGERLAASRSCRSVTGRRRPGVRTRSAARRRVADLPVHPARRAPGAVRRGLPRAGAEHGCRPTRWHWTSSGSAHSPTCCSPASRRRRPGPSCWPGWPRRTGCVRPRWRTRSRSSWTSWCRRRPRPYRPAGSPPWPSCWRCCNWSRRSSPHRRSSSEEPVEPIDLLEAKVGDVVADWQIKKKLGTGSTSRAFLAENSRTGALEVLKVALSDEKAARLAHEAQVLRGLHKDSRVIRLAREEPIELPPRSMIVLEHAGEKTLARKLREDGRLTVDELETYADYLFGAVDHLQGEGVFHRDIKPDNIAIRIRPNRTRQLVLFDFSLAAVPVDEIEAGTPRYLDPFLGSTSRPVYDEHAERYAVAVTLHEMASGELPVWGDDDTNAAVRRGTGGAGGRGVRPGDPYRPGRVLRPRAAPGREPPARLAEGDAGRLAAGVPPVRPHRAGRVGAPGRRGRATVADRDEAAAKATRATVLEASGLTPRAVSAAHRLDATTVGTCSRLVRSSSSPCRVSAPRRGGELQRRLREWRGRLGEQERSPLAAGERAEAAAEVAAEVALAEAEPGHEGPSPADLARVGLDAITARLVPARQRTGRNQTEVDAVRLVLGLPDEEGHLPALPPWPQQSQVAPLVGVTAGRIAQILIAQRKRWLADPVVASVRAELIALLADTGRVMGATELAAALLMRRGSTRDGEVLRRTVALAAVRAAVEIDPLAEEPRFAVRRHTEKSPDGTQRDRLLLALEVSADESPDTPSAPALLDLADALGKTADRLAEQEVLPSPATVLRELTAVAGRSVGSDAGLDDRRVVQLAAVASVNAAASPRLEIYPRDLDPVRALRLAQAGLVPPAATERAAELTRRQIQERVRARFPELAELPDHPQLGHLLAAAGFSLVWRAGAYHPRPGTGSSTRLSGARRRSTGTGVTEWTAGSPELAAALRTEQQLQSAGGIGGFRALTIRTDRYALARQELGSRFGVRPFNVAERFLAELRALVDARPKPTWQTVLAADAADPNSRDALKLAEFAAKAWQQLRPELRALPERGAPVLLFDAAPLARYRAMDLLDELADVARGGAGAVWLLCPMEDPGQLPRLDNAVVPVAEDEWVILHDAWAANEHRGTSRTR